MPLSCDDVMGLQSDGKVRCTNLSVGRWTDIRQIDYFTGYIINDGLEKDNVGYRLNDLTLIRKGNYQDAVNTFDTPDFGSDVSKSGTFVLAKGTFSDGEETDVCIYRYQESSKSTIILTGPCK